MKKSKIQNSKPLSDAQLKALLAGLREEVAAPAGFRSQVMRRVEIEMGVPAVGADLRPAPTLPWRLFAFFKSPVFLGAAASVAVALGFWLAAPQAKQAQSESVGARSSAPVLAAAPASKKMAPSRQSRDSLAHVQSQNVAPIPAGAGLRPAPTTRESVASTQIKNSAPAPASRESVAGNAPVAQAPEVPHFAGSSSAPAPAARAGAADVAKPIIIEIKPTATPLSTPLRSSSELRRNLFHPAKGEYASLLFNLARPDQVRVEIFNRLGQRVAVLADGQYPAGLTELRWLGFDDKGQDAPAGIYLMRVRANGMDDQHKAVVVR